ncbi:MAG: hypothetical protein II986_07925 [Alistipes sp.]|nr:hypothetical protein [Alistipes sp.]
MDVSEIIFTAIIAVAGVTKIIDSVKGKSKQTPEIEDNTQTISSDGLDTCIEVTPLEITKPVQQPVRKEVKKVATTTPKKAENKTKINSDDSDENTFDLRKAVIYSEILTPKFKDEEF